MRARRRPTTQSHVTNVRDNPVQIAADAAEGALRGFDEQETTVAVARYAPFNAVAIMDLVRKLDVRRINSMFIGGSNRARSRDAWVHCLCRNDLCLWN